MNRVNFSERLKLAMKEAGYTQGSLAKKVNMAQSSVWRLVSGGGESSKKIFPIAQILGVNPAWLAEGVGEMRPHLNTSQSFSSFDTVAGYSLNQEVQKEVYPLKIYHRIDGVLSPSVGGEKDFEVMFWLPKVVLMQTNASIDDSIAVVAQDNSMSPIINEKSMVIFDTSYKEIKNGKIYAISFGGISMFRTLFVLPEEKIRLKSHNSADYPEVIVPMNELVVIGKVYYVSGIID
ncbi:MULTISPECIES: XRE family transcriptional regulator [Candidatus Williamhamiltonella]|uniref:Phage repressor n=2 Tax=Candidatus Williamhamiltonella defendens TaxID=138072 RepID=C4K549_HAMD5|nr:S24 family peptidase [Candidatus Hamiltonella defensa]ACQ67692.1 putative phage repressor [Candidatus Hamiltonella defensa 5AT (Acyrthosiphon pisum)]ATW22389.1 repressor [Candidatus Hamiltonella defensa]